VKRRSALSTRGRRATIATVSGKGAEQSTPLAGMAIQSTTDRMLSAFDGGHGGMPIGPWQGLGVAFAWALGALALRFLLLRYRDV
jgi:hypothetical protein